MANTAPNTPETPRRIAMNRSFTLPSKLQTTSRNAATAEIGASENIETLYVHPAATIVKFSTLPASRPNSAGSPRSPLSPSKGGTSSWRSPTERTLASGPVEIYRVPGSVSFLHSGTLLHAIMPRSLCWCLDNVSKFALRVPVPDTYYRIELPAETPEDLEKVEELKLVLANVCFYERTACPFDRGVEEEKPTVEELDGRKKTRRRSHGPAKKWKMERAYSWKPEDGEERRPSQQVIDESEDSGEVGSSEEDAESGAERSQSRSREESKSEEIRAKKIETSSRPSRLEALRSITAPPQLLTRTTPPPRRLRASVLVDGSVEVSEPPAPAQAVSTPRLDPGRLRTFQPIPTDMPPSPPDSSAGLELGDAPVRPQQAEVQEDETEQAPVIEASKSPKAIDEAPQEPVTSESEHALERTNTLEALEGFHAPEQGLEDPAERQHAPQDDSAHRVAPPSAPTQKAAAATEEHELPSLIHQGSPEDPFAAIQARILARRSIGGTTSFHPSRSSPPRSSHSSASSTATIASRRSEALPRSREGQQTLASALVKKACAVFLGPPAHLVALMLRIAARFANGALGIGSSFIYQSPAGSKHVPGSFNLESIDANDFEATEELENWEEDDFGVPLRSPIRLAALAGEGDSRFVRERRGWEID